MKPLSIRFKLTAWYLAVLITTIAVFGATAFLAMRKGIDVSVDEGLEDQASAIGRLVAEALPQGQETLADELREHSELRPEGNFCQIPDEHGGWIYRSPLMARFDVPPPESGTRSVYDLEVKGLPLRVLVRNTTLNGTIYRVQVAAPMDDFYDSLDRFKWVVLLLSPVLLILGSAGGYWLSRRALSPVDDITRAAQDIHAKNLSKRLKVPQSGDELQRLSETLNSTFERLESAFSRITQFTADASHELRTPLALMRTTTEVSLRTSSTVSEHRQAQAQVLEELEKTSNLVERLMLLARADAGVETLQRERINLADIVRETCREGRTLAEAKQIAFSEDLAADSVVLEGDSQSLHRLFLILIDNAVKYTPPRGTITVSLARRNQSALVEVRDSGIGIATQDLPHIFDRFYRADKARSREFGGAGLGLSIARWEAEAHGGEIDVESTLSQGSLFRVRLPLSSD
jgi:two-component system, OmpR family, heavy metal sensor histidine kinase CusS